MNGDLFSFFTGTPWAIGNTAIQAVSNWWGTCLSGACTSYPDTAWNTLLNRMATPDAWFGNITGKAVSMILGMLPPGGGLPPEMHTAALYFGNALQSVGWFLPVSDLVNCMLIVLSVKMMLWSLHILELVINFVRGIPTAKFEGSSGLPDMTYSPAEQQRAFWGA